MELLLKADIKINIKNQLGRNALEHCIVKTGTTKEGICMLLYAAGESTDYSTAVGLQQLPVPGSPLHGDLKHLCRECIRKHLLELDPHTHLFYRVPKLGLPRTLCSYLLYDMAIGDPIPISAEEFREMKPVSATDKAHSPDFAAKSCIRSTFRPAPSGTPFNPAFTPAPSRTPSISAVAPVPPENMAFTPFTSETPSNLLFTAAPSGTLSNLAFTPTPSNQQIEQDFSTASMVDSTTDWVKDTAADGDNDKSDHGDDDGPALS